MILFKFRNLSNSLARKKTCTNLHMFMQESNQRTVHATSMLGDLDGASDGDIGIPFSLSLRKPHRVAARKGVYDFNATLSKQWLLQNLPLNFLTNWFDQISSSFMQDEASNLFVSIHLVIWIRFFGLFTSVVKSQIP